VSDSKVSRQIGVRLPLDMYATLDALAKAQRRSIGFLVRDFVAEGLEREAKVKAKLSKK
jgi:predicted DNA-binding protein